MNIDTQLSNPEFLAFVESRKAIFPELNIEEGLESFRLYWSEGRRQLKRPKMAFNNWLKNERRFAEERKHREGQPTYGRTKQPEQYTNPESIRH